MFANRFPDYASLHPATNALRTPRRDQFGRVVLQHLDVFLAASGRQQRDAVMARHHVHMQVEHDLPAGGLVELLHGDAVGVEGFIAAAAIL